MSRLYMLDTNTVSYIIKGKSAASRLDLPRYNRTRLPISRRSPRQNSSTDLLSLEAANSVAKRSTGFCYD
jgi:hypothetical protein